MITSQQLLEKVKQNLSIDFDEQDNFLLSLIEAVKGIASERTGIDFEIEEMPKAVEMSIVENVANKFDDNSIPINQTVFQMFNKRAML